MPGELVIVAIALLIAGVALLCPGGRRRQRGATSAPREPGEGTWTAAGGPLDAAFPREHTPHERDIGDAAFVDGFVVGRYLTPDPRPSLERRDTGDPVRLDGSASDVDLDDGSASDVDLDDAAGFDDRFDDGFGSEDGCGDDW